MGATLLVAGHRRARRPALVGPIAVGLCLLAPVGVYASWIEPARLRLERATVSLDEARAGDGPIRVGVLADIQTTRVTDYEIGAVDRLMAERPDVIVLPGDLFQRPGRLDDERPALRRLLGRLSAPGGVFFVLGDSDTRLGIESVTAGTGVRLVENGVVTTRVGGRPLTLGGIELPYGSPEARRVVRRLETVPAGATSACS